MRLARLLALLCLLAGPALADQQPINVGSAIGKGDGDALRVAFGKVNANDADLYARIASLQQQIAAIQAVSGKLQALQNGTLDGVVIGGSAPAAGFFTTLSASGGLAGNASTASALANLRTLTASGDATCSFLFDGSANAACTLTLSTSGVTAGSYGSATAVPAVTVDAKGRVTGVAATPIAFPVTSVAGRAGAVTLGVADVSGAAPLASPAFTGAPTVPTAAAGTSTTQIASTAFATAAVATETSRAQSAESANASNIAANSTAISNEASRAQAAEALLAPKARQVVAGAGLTGGGDLTADRTLSLGGVASGAILANLTGAAAPPGASTLSAILDNAIGSARGTLAVRGASGWAGLALGASGTTLQSNGADAVFAATSPGTGAVRYDTSQGLTGTQQGQGRSNLAAAASGANSDITALSGLTTALSLGQGGTGGTSAATARSSLGAAASGANADITSLAGPALGAATAAAPAAADSSTKVPTTAFLTAAALRGDLAQSLTSAQQDQVRSNLSGPVSSAPSASATLVVGDIDRPLLPTGTITLTVPNGGAGWRTGSIRNSNTSTGLVTLAVPSGATLDGATNGTTVLYPYQRARIVQTGATAYLTDWIDRSPILGNPVTASGVASADLTLPDGYGFFEILLGNIKPGTNGTGLVARVSLDGTAFAAGASDYGRNVFESANGTAPSSGTGSFFEIATPISATNGNASGKLTITQPPAGNYVGLKGEAQFYDSTGAYANYVSGGVYGSATGRAKAVRLLFTSGTGGFTATVRAVP